MTTRIKRRGAFCPSMTEAKLEERLVLSSASAVTPPAAPPPFISGSIFQSRFNNGFMSNTSSGFVGFGSAPSALNTNVGAGINTPVSPVSHSLYLGMISTSGGVPFILR